ncbi:MAG: hypothetical protein ACJZ9G_12370 [Rhodospirillales bacterium]
MPFFRARLGHIDVYPESGKLPELLGLKLRHEKHTGIGDSRSILEALRHLNSAE